MNNLNKQNVKFYIAKRFIFPNCFAGGYNNINSKIKREYLGKKLRKVSNFVEKMNLTFCFIMFAFKNIFHVLPSVSTAFN